MDRTERFYKINQLLENQRRVSFSQMQEACEVSRATLQRDLEYMRTRLNAPIVWDRETSSYQLSATQPQLGGQYELPGLWFSSQEIHALLTMQHLLANLDPGGLLSQHIEPLQLRLNTLLGAAQDAVPEIRKRVLVVGIGKRSIKLAHFERVGSALLRRKRLRLTYFARSTDELTEREVSPQRLVYYRENWYLDAWCHLREGLRNFAIDSIREVDLVDTRARDVARKTVESVLGPGYGIFTGTATDTAVLRFTPERALGGHRELAPGATRRVRGRRRLHAARTLCRSPRTHHGHHEIRRRLRGSQTREVAPRRQPGTWPRTRPLHRGRLTRDDARQHGIT